MVPVHRGICAIGLLYWHMIIQWYIKTAFATKSHTQIIAIAKYNTLVTQCVSNELPQSCIKPLKSPELITWLFTMYHLQGHGKLSLNIAEQVSTFIVHKSTSNLTNFMTMETSSALPVLCERKPPVTGGFPLQWGVWCYICCQNKRSCDLWRQYAHMTSL